MFINIEKLEASCETRIYWDIETLSIGLTLQWNESQLSQMDTTLTRIRGTHSYFHMSPFPVLKATRHICLKNL